MKCWLLQDRALKCLQIVSLVNLRLQKSLGLLSNNRPKTFSILIEVAEDKRVTWLESCSNWLAKPAGTAGSWIVRSDIDFNWLQQIEATVHCCWCMAVRPKKAVRLSGKNSGACEKIVVLSKLGQKSEPIRIRRRWSTVRFEDLSVSLFVRCMFLTERNRQSDSGRRIFSYFWQQGEKRRLTLAKQIGFMPESVAYAQ